jgi:tRNA dimethylallyltransferase
MQNKMPAKNLITILGPTSAGKSDMAIGLCKKLPSCCIVNCDSRQIYKGLNIGTGKINGSWQQTSGENVFLAQNQPHFLIDYVDPMRIYSMAHWLNDFHKFSQQTIYNTIILVGGNGLWADAVINNYRLPKYNLDQQKLLEQTKKILQEKPLSELQNAYSRLYTDILNPSEFANKTRLVNYLLRKNKKLQTNKYLDIPRFTNYFGFNLTLDPELLQTKIKNRFQKRFTLGLLDEVKNLNLPSYRLQTLGLEYRIADNYLQGKISKEQMLQQMLHKNLQYAKRQLTWLAKRNLVKIKTLDELIKTLPATITDR